MMSEDREMWSFDAGGYEGEITVTAHGNGVFFEIEKEMAVGSYNEDFLCDCFVPLDKLDDLIAVLQRALADMLSSTAIAPTNWQPIETLPEDRKDGRQVLLWSKLYKAVTATWRGDKSPRWGAGWDAGFSTRDNDYDDVTDATHWADINPPE